MGFSPWRAEIEVTIRLLLSHRNEHATLAVRFSDTFTKSHGRKINAAWERHPFAVHVIYLDHTLAHRHAFVTTSRNIRRFKFCIVFKHVLYTHRTQFWNFCREDTEHPQTLTWFLWFFSGIDCHSTLMHWLNYDCFSPYYPLAFLIVLKRQVKKCRKSINTEWDPGTRKQPMQGNDVERKGNTNLKGISFTSILWVLELIDRTLVYWVFLLQVENEVRIEFSREKHRGGKGIQKW